jgi:hypothetical protein
MQVWQADTSFIVRDARISGDTLYASAIRIPLSTADSVRTRQLDLGKTFLAACGAGIAGITVIWFSIRGATEAT